MPGQQDRRGEHHRPGAANQGMSPIAASRTSSPREPLSLPFVGPARIGTSTWLLHLRSFAVAGQLLTILATAMLTEIPLRYGPLLGLVALTALTNLIYAAWLRLIPQSADHPHFIAEELDSEHPTMYRVALGLMLLDLAMLTWMLHFSGGADNPFSFFYFVNLAVGGVMIRPRAAWLMTGLAVLGYTFLLFFSDPVDAISGGVVRHGWNIRTLGLLLAFTTCATVVTYFVTRTSGELQQRERQLRHAQLARAKDQRLEGLTTLAAGAAHELATPLSTIDVIVRELSRHLEACEKPKSVDTDLKLIDGQLEMCRQILARMRSAAGDFMAMRWNQSTVGELIDCALEGVRDPHRVDVDDGNETVENQPLWVPQEAVAQAIRNLIHNGLDASGQAGRVRLSSKLVGDHVVLSVVDHGEGMSEEVMGRAVDPFFTTKEPGRGIGLGLFLTRNVISQLGGSIDFRSTQGAGTEVVVSLPLECRPSVHSSISIPPEKPSEPIAADSTEITRTPRNRLG